MAALPTHMPGSKHFRSANPTAAFCTALHPANDKADFFVQAWHNALKVEFTRKQADFASNDNSYLFWFFPYNLTSVRRGCRRLSRHLCPPFDITQKNTHSICRVCIRQYSKNTQKPVLQGRNESTSRKVRTLFLYMPLKLQSAHWFFLKIFCRMKAPKKHRRFLR